MNKAHLNRNVFSGNSISLAWIEMLKYCDYVLAEMCHFSFKCDLHVHLTAKNWMWNENDFDREISAMGSVMCLS